jgi:hypothetical protein
MVMGGVLSVLVGLEEASISAAWPAMAVLHAEKRVGKWRLRLWESLHNKNKTNTLLWLANKCTQWLYFSCLLTFLAAHFNDDSIESVSCDY